MDNYVSLRERAIILRDNKQEPALKEAMRQALISDLFLIFF